MNEDFLMAISSLEKEKGIKKEVLLDAIEAALISAYKRNFNSSANARVQMNSETGEIKVYSLLNIVEEVENSQQEASLQEAHQYDAKLELGDVLEKEVTPKNFGRIAAQTAKQVVIQRIREAERELVYEDFLDRQGDVITGIVQRFEQKNIVIDLGRAEGILAQNEQMPGDDYKQGQRVKIYLAEVKKTTKGPQILVSRSHPGLLKRLFELEVPEIYNGIVEIKGAVREAGLRSKIAVYSKDENVDPVGACVGPKGGRVQAIVSELNGEKIDIIKWDEDPQIYLASSLSPAKVIKVIVVKEDNKMARVVVPDYQLSLAIGKEGQNARLAAKLTGWKVDIVSETQEKERFALEEDKDIIEPSEDNDDNTELDIEVEESETKGDINIIVD